MIYLIHMQRHFATVNVSSVSFCTLDPKNKKLFAFINRKKKRKFCHVFQANEQDVCLCFLVLYHTGHSIMQNYITECLCMH